jgi:hypothetical protein
MRVTDHRYEGELDRFDLAIRMIRHEARTGTIRACTGFSEDLIRKIYSAYFKPEGKPSVKRRRGRSPTRVARFVSSTARQSEATLLACLFLHCEAAVLRGGRPVRDGDSDRVLLGQRLCQAFEAYLDLQESPQLTFEWAWNLYHSLVDSQELLLAHCDLCGGIYVQDAYALDYRRCPFCEMKDHAVARS